MDETTGQISDTTTTNNGDRDIILATVARIIYDFTELFPDAAIFIQGSDPVRTRLYQQGINKFWHQIDPLFKIIAYKSGNWLPFEKGKNYESFLGIRKVGY